MGGSQSVRKLTIENDEFEGNVIRISDSVAKRLAASSAAATSPESQTPSKVKNVEPTKTSHIRETSDGDNFVPVFTISALEMQQQKERELAEQETYYQKRLQNLEQTHEKINKAIEDEYKKALSMFDNSKMVKAQSSVKPCIENRKKVLKCYQENPRETLRCANLVEQFSHCVDQRRMELMS